jgi:type IX secretion system PorP/SprF family membrane protein
MIRPVGIGIMIILLAGSVSGQSMENYTPVNMYMLNPLVLNPAYSGARESISVNLLTGTNGLNLNSNVIGARYTSAMGSVTLDVPISTKMSVGGTLIHNSYGVNHNTIVYGHYGYRIITGAGDLSFGLRGGLNHYIRNLNNASFRDPGDPVQVSEPRWFPNFGAGVYWQGINYYAGFSIPEFFAPPKKSNAFEASPKYYNYTLMGGYLFDVSDQVRLKPSALFTFAQNNPLVYQINLSMITAYDRLFFSLGYKPQGIVTMFEYQINSLWRIGAAWQYPLGGFGRISGQAFEIFIRRDATYEVRDVSRTYFF